MTGTPGSKGRRVHLDYAATTGLDPRVEAAMRPYHHLPGNASSVHASGRAAREALEDARERLARCIGAQAREITFTSGGTEADNQAILGLTLERGGHVITTAIEHSAVLAPARWLERSGRCRVTYLPPDEHGIVHPEQLSEAICPDTVLVSVMHLNNEVGSIQDIPAIAAECRERGVPLHVDAVQSLGALPLDVSALGADLLSLSAHKVHGPKGVGALWVRLGLELTPIIHGGHQERGLRGGTSNLPGAVGMALAAEIAVAEQPAEAERLTALLNRFAGQLLTIEGVSLNGHSERRGPRHVNVTAHGCDGEALLMNLDLE
ncbi:MAG TPA: cysteine desulfurase family protein, partial [Deinococcales bacterium]|nr:cysteine desulfurase family protein [Deinococcales bacterium]